MLKITDLTVAYEHDGNWLTAVQDFCLEISPGQTYGLVGESGSGKTTVAMAILNFLAGRGRVVGGRIELNGRDILGLSQNEMRQVWGREINLVPQDPLSSLNPSIRIGEQIAESLRSNLGLTVGQAAERSESLLSMVKVPDPARVARSYPHEISGGMQQRVLIALALSTEPKVLVLDEPTTSLDVTTEAVILDLLRDLIRNRQTAILYITHNLGVVARLCDRVAVLYAGEKVEDAPTAEVYHRPIHPYTKGLLDSVPKLGQNKVNGSLPAIPGRIPSLPERPSACVFSPRCPLAIDKCFSDRPQMESVVQGREVRCHRWPDILSGEISAGLDETKRSDGVPPAKIKPLLTLEGVKVGFGINRSLMDLLSGKPRQALNAVDGVELTIPQGLTLGLVGESGSGKTTLARTIIGLAERTAGDIELLGINLPVNLSSRDIDTLRLVQYVFQNPEEALNPYMTIGETLRRPFITLLGMSGPEADAHVAILLEMVRLSTDYADRYPRQISGGEKQRVAIARAFATSPMLLLADEPVSSLDVSVQASILNLMDELHVRNGSAMLFISHDLAVVGYLADQIAVMYAGHLVELGATSDLLRPPYHPYTEALLSAVPNINPDVIQQTIRLEGDLPSQIDTPNGCRFHPRCPRLLGEVCRVEVPPWRVTDQGKQIKCHIPLHDLVEKQSAVIQNTRKF
jgi:peptide/nickel transport system ATP-binding protein